MCGMQKNARDINSSTRLWLSPPGTIRSSTPSFSAPASTDFKAGMWEAAPVDTGLDVGRLNFRYAIEGDTPAWRPLPAFDDGAAGSARDGGQMGSLGFASRCPIAKGPEPAKTRAARDAR